jgi:hypothetical protein
VRRGAGEGPADEPRAPRALTLPPERGARRFRSDMASPGAVSPAGRCCGPSCGASDDRAPPAACSRLLRSSAAQQGGSWAMRARGGLRRVWALWEGRSARDQGEHRGAPAPSRAARSRPARLAYALPGRRRRLASPLVAALAPRPARRPALAGSATGYWAPQRARHHTERIQQPCWGRRLCTRAGGRHGARGTGGAPQRPRRARRARRAAGGVAGRGKIEWLGV